ncbi:MAG: hypothetical protein QW207_01125 [Candidatus Micrarchaeaceae archaeon]
MEVRISLSESELSAEDPVPEKHFGKMSSSEIKEALKADFPKVSEDLIKYTITARDERWKVLKALDELVYEDPRYAKAAAASKEAIETIEWLQRLKEG